MLNFFLTFQTTTLLIPFQIDNDMLTQSIYAVIAIFLFVIIALLIILAMREEEITGYTSKILRKIKIQTHTFWSYGKKYKKLLRIISYIALASFIMYLEYNLAHRALIIITEHSTITQELQNELNTTTKNEKFSKINSLRNELFLCISGIIISAPLAIIPFIKNIKSKLENHILRTFVATVIFGGFFSFFIPVLLYQNNFIGDTKDLTTALLGVTGGVVALFSLIKSHQKSELEREQLEVQKQKDNRDHIRQIHAARRDRYIEAVDKLSSDQAPVRLGGVYALTGLIDEWLDDDNIDAETRIKEGQVIINNLCSYVRSPFPLAEKIDEYKAFKRLEELNKRDSKKILAELESYDREILSKRFPNPQNYKEPKNITKNFAKFSEEQDVRRTIFVEMSKRSSNIIKDESNVIKTTPGIWSNFEFDFSRAPVFYSLGNLKIEKGNFSTAKFYFYAGANFNGVTFIEKADFLGAIFIDRAYFADATFIRGVDFSWSELGDATFFTTKFIEKSDFSDASFSDVTFFGANFTENAIFCRTDFTSNAVFFATTFARNVNFSEATFAETVNFRETTFTRAVKFSGAKFTKLEPSFVLKKWKAQFSAAVNPQDYDFSATPVGKSISCGYTTLLGETFKIPLGTVLFDPMSPKYEDGTYSGLSEPAEPIEESDNRGETPSK